MLFKNSSNIINFTLNCNGKLIYVHKPIVMGIVNITPDSFYQHSRKQNVEDIVLVVEKMIQEGVSIIDLGAQSTRPKSDLLTWQQEWERLEQPLIAIKKAFPEVLISIDTFYSTIAENAVTLGADMINDVSGGSIDEKMIATVGKLNVPYICMHMQGTPQTMQNNPTYNDVVQEVLDYFIAKKLECNISGIKDVLFDVGFGFGKTIEHNFSLLKNLSVFKNILGNPLLVGISRKSMISKTLQITSEESLYGTTALHMIALQNGASILRVHDVKEAIQTIQLYEKYCSVE